MRTDTYTKAMLTVIALCLLWIALGGPSLITPVGAQNRDQRVVITGWQASPFGTSDTPRALPLPITTDTNRR